MHVWPRINRLNHILIDLCACTSASNNKTAVTAANSSGIGDGTAVEVLGNKRARTSQVGHRVEAWQFRCRQRAKYRPRLPDFSWDASRMIGFVWGTAPGHGILASRPASANGGHCWPRQLPRLVDLGAGLGHLLRVTWAYVRAALI